ncbi:MAG: 2Fe-2S iron-sulfur cluster-binding protein [Candidatus Omnitrophota bacterium]|nr:2Fe-2S iron-sulfur cluster-binding protein [Candidatus Omnitrophota bacterium]
MTVKLTIDGKEVEAKKGTRVIEAAKLAGTDVPFYCYHPGLSIAGNCRMCLVEVEKIPKLQIACHTHVQDGMVVHTNTERVLKTRQHILEFLLINHPVDCPVCDQAGECWLQDYYMRYGLYDSRLNEDKIKKPKATSIGPTVMLDAERCILCSRCVRFCDEISKTSELGIINRGDHSEIAVFPDHELSNPYAGNVVDICPVGALTDKDFRFKIRVWYLKSENTICNGCSRGCNIQVQYNLDRPHHSRGERVKRLKPRFNERINKWWMCDEGRYGYKYHDHNRTTAPLLRLAADIHEVSWDEAYGQVATWMRHSGYDVGVFLSPQMSNEELYLAKRLYVDQLGIKDVFLLSPNADGFEDDLLIRADKNPNSRGAEELGFKYDGGRLKDFCSRAAQGKVKGLIAFGQDLQALLEGAGIQAALDKLEWTLFIGSNHNLMSESSSLVLPAATYVEKEGTFTNFEGIVQKFNKVLEPLSESLPEWLILVNLSRTLNLPLRFESAGEIFGALAADYKLFEGLNYEKLESDPATVEVMSAPTIPDLEQQSALIFRQEPSC